MSEPSLKPKRHRSWSWKRLVLPGHRSFGPAERLLGAVAGALAEGQRPQQLLERLCQDLQAGARARIGLAYRMAEGGLKRCAISGHSGTGSALDALEEAIRAAGATGAFVLDSREAKALEALDLQAGCGQPLELDGRVLGLVFLGFRRRAAFKAALRPAMERAARLAAIHLRRLELEDAAREAERLRGELSAAQEAERQIHEREEQSRSALEAAGCGLLACTIDSDPKGSRILWCNSTFLNLSGHSVEEVVGSNPGTLLDLERRDSPARIGAGAAPDGLGLELLTKEGRRLPVEVFKTAPWGRGWALSVVRDASGQRRLMHELGKYKERLESLVQQRTATLQAREALWQACVEKSPDAVLIVDGTGCIEEANPEACKALGLGQVKLRTLSVAELFSPEQRVAGLAAFGDALRSGESRFEGAFRGAEGAALWWQVDFRRIADGRVIVFARDTTAQHAEDEAQRLHALAMEQAPHAFSMAGVDGCLTDANQQFLRLWGYDQAGQVLGKPIGRFLQEPDPVVGLLQELFRDDEWEGDVVGLKSDGQPFNAHGSARLLRNDLGMPEKVVASFMDLSGRKALEDDLRRNEERYRQIVEACPDAIAIVSDGRWVFLNAAGARLLGSERPESFLGQPYLDSIHPLEWVKARDRLHFVASEGQSVDFFRQRIVRRNGGILMVVGSAVPVIYQGSLSVQLSLREDYEQG